VVVSLQQKEEIGEMPIRVILAENEEAKFEGMAGADYAVAVNGEIVNECAAFQLPTLIINETQLWKAYFTLMYNSFGTYLKTDSDLNFTANGSIYPELMACRFGDAFPAKLADWFKEFQDLPKTRFLMAKRLTPILL